MDKEKAIKGLHQHCEGSMFDRCGECPYYDVADEPFICRDMLLNDLNALLKEQETVELKTGHWFKIHGGTAAQCTICKCWGQIRMKFCPWCGAKMET